jgi:hypothetical protein
MEREILKKRRAFSRKRRDEIPPHRGSARDVPGSRHVRCDGRLAGGVLCLAWPARKSAQDGQSRPADRDPAGPYGASPAIWRAEGHTASRGRVERLMRHHGIRTITPRRFRACTTDSHHDLPIAANRLDQKFAAGGGPIGFGSASITCVPTGEGWRYLAAVLDLLTRRIVDGRCVTRCGRN